MSQGNWRGATAQGQVSYRRSFEDLQIPLPPLDEQRRIAAILDAADALRAKRREALAQLDTPSSNPPSSTMFGDPVTNPNGVGGTFNLKEAKSRVQDRIIWKHSSSRKTS